MDPLRVVAVVEAHTVTGPAKNLLRLAKAARTPLPGQPPVHISFLTFHREPSANTDRASNSFIEAARAAGIVVDVVGERFVFDPGVIFRMQAVLRQRRPHFVQTHAVKAHFLFWLSQWRRQARWIAFHHGYTTEDLKTRLYNSLNHITLPAADHVITVCRPFHELLVSHGVEPSRITVVPNSIEPVSPTAPEAVQSLKLRYGFTPNERILLSVGRFSSEKGHSDLIVAMKQIVQEFTEAPVRHVLVGDGLEREHLERAAEAAGVRHCFVFAGHHQDVQLFYAMADIFVLPSHSEGSPNVLLEAMSAGLPVVGTEVGGVPEAVDHEISGLLVPPRQPAALASAVVRLLQDTQAAIQFGHAAKAAVLSHFSPEAQRRSIVDVYKRLLPSITPAGMVA
jgi:glycosyltransferase involved in cell wall biosynthesis